jgi:hypothetical protein
MAAQSDRICLAGMCLMLPPWKHIADYASVVPGIVGQEERCATNMVARPLLAPVCDRLQGK